MKDLVNLQLEREYQQSVEARARALQSLYDAMESGNIDRIPAARVLIARTYKTISDTLEHTLKNTPTSTVGLDWLRLVGPEKAVVLLLRRMCALTVKGEQATVQKICIDLGRHIIEEGMAIQAEKVNPLYMQKTYLYMQNRGVKSEHHARLTLKAALKIVMRDSSDDISPGVALQTGKWVLQAAMADDLITMTRINGSKHGLPVYKLNDYLEEVLFSTGFADSVDGVGLLMMCPPNEWEPNMIGGYLAPTKNPLARKFKKDDHKLARAGLEQSKEYLNALNVLQGVPFSINQKAISIVRRIWLKQGNNLLSIPSIEPARAPNFPFPDTWLKQEATEHEMEVFKEWCHRKSEWYTEELKRKGEASRVGVMLKEAVELKEGPVFSPVFGDWRGRIYYQGTPNPQGPDYSRAAIQFHDKLPLGESGLFWLKVHIANSFGQDKGRFKTRAQWVDDNMESLVEGMLNPELSDIYTEVADYPVLAATAVQELVQALDSPRPEDFMSGMPIHMDATCSGLQHYSAMLRDPVGGRLTNLVDDGQPEKADVYNKVLDILKMALLEDLASGPNQVMSELWLKTDLNRSLTKNPVMTYVYRSTLRGVSTYVRGWLNKQGFEANGVSSFAMSDYLAALLFKSISKAVPAAAACMEWVCTCARLNGAQKPFEWLTPVGTRISQTYRKSQQQKIFIRSCNLQSVMVLRDLPTMKVSKMVQGCAPNFIHSMDSSHVVRVANKAHTQGMQMIGIHDSLATHPCNVGELHKIIRSEFVGMYEEQDVLDSIVKLNGLDLEIPKKGNLDLRRVLDSEFFFC